MQICPYQLCALKNIFNNQVLIQWKMLFLCPLINKEIRLNKYTVQINYKISSNAHFNAMLNLQGVFHI